MGRGVASIYPILIGLFFFFSFLARAKEGAPCVAQVYDLGAAVEVPEVEMIARFRAEDLDRYTRGLSVQQQLRQVRHVGFVAAIGERPVGFIVLERKDLHLNVISIAVAEGMEGQGIGRQLMERAVAAAKAMPGMEQLKVLVAYDDERARGFFTAMEFKETEIISRKFDRQSKSGVLYKLELVSAEEKARIPQPQLAPAPKPKVQVATAVITIPMERLRELDPTLENALE